MACTLARRPHTSIADFTHGSAKARGPAIAAAVDDRTGKPPASGWRRLGVIIIPPDSIGVVDKKVVLVGRHRARPDG